MKKLVVLLMVSLMAASAFATVDEDPDMLGVYFDLNANDNCGTFGPSVPFNVYFMITNVSAANVFGVEFGYELVGGTGLYFRLAEILPAGSLNVGTATNPAVGDYIVGFANPIPGSGANATVVTWQLLLLAPTSIDIYLGSSFSESIPDGLPAMEIGGTIAPLGLSTGIGNPAATINGDCVVATDDVSFGSVKSLFR
jgi:hypothetical protein